MMKSEYNGNTGEYKIYSEYTGELIDSGTKPLSEFYAHVTTLRRIEKQAYEAGQAYLKSKIANL